MPVIRVGAVDNIAHVTEFTSAADHMMTLRKMQELEMPISRDLSGTLRDLVEDTKGRQDYLDWERDGSSVEMERRPPASVRWRHRGPWVSNLTEPEFQRYLQKTVRPRKHEFREYLRQHFQSMAASDRRRLATERGHLEQTSGVGLSDAELDRRIRWLRRHQTLLQQLLANFLDLPASTGSATSNRAAPRSMGFRTADGGESDVGPLHTHPSAGLSYLRTASTISNHPLHGPQALPPPVRARVLATRRTLQRGARTVKVGVAGVVTGDVSGLDTGSKYRAASEPGVLNLDPLTDGGSKILVQPTRVSIENHGQIRLQLMVHPSSPSYPTKDIRGPTRLAGSVSGADLPRQRALAYTPGARAGSIKATYGLGGLFSSPFDRSSARPSPTANPGGRSSIYDGVTSLLDET